MPTSLVLALQLWLTPAVAVVPAPADAPVEVQQLTAALQALHPGPAARWPGGEVAARVVLSPGGPRLEVFRAAHRRVLSARLTGLAGADLATRREAVAHVLGYLLEAGPQAGEPLARPAARPPAPPRPIPAAAPLPADRLGELVPPLPAFPSRPPLVLPRPPTPPAAPTGAQVDVWRDDPRAVPTHSRSDTIASAREHAPPRVEAGALDADRMWLCLDLAWAGEPTGGVGLGAAFQLSGPWTVRGEVDFEPFGTVGSPDGPLPLVDLYGNLGLERRLTDGPAIMRAHAGLGWQTLFAQTDAISADPAHRPVAVLGGSMALAVGGPLSVGLRMDLQAGPWVLEAESASARMRRPRLQGRLGAWLGWQL